MRFTRRPRCAHEVTDRKRAAAVRRRRHRRDAPPLLAPRIAEARACTDAAMAERVGCLDRAEQDWRDRRAGQLR